MTVNRGPGVALVGTIGTTPKEHRLALAGQYAENAPGVPRSGVLVRADTNVVTPTASMGYNVAPVASVIARTVGEGVYTPTTTGTTTVLTGNAPATGSRWDLIWIKQNDQEKGDADNAAIVGVASGTAAASPVMPLGLVPAGAMLLAVARIFAATTTTTASPNTVTQTFRHTAARGTPIPLRSLTERAEITAPALGQLVIRTELPSMPLELWDGTAWVRFTGIRQAEYSGPAFQTSPGSGTNFGGPGGGVFVTDTTKTFNNDFVQPDIGGRVKILQTGVYRISGIILPTSVPAEYTLSIIDVTHGTVLGCRGGKGYGDKEQSVDAPNHYLVAGTVLQFGLAMANSVLMGSRIRVTKDQ